jgi:hypothetical protein
MRIVAVVLACVLTAITFVDPLCCADGCTRTGPAAANHATRAGGECPICHPGSVPALPKLPDAGPFVASKLVLPEQSAIDSIPRSIEHPPRA